MDPQQPIANNQGQITNFPDDQNQTITQRIVQDDTNIQKNSLVQNHPTKPKRTQQPSTRSYHPVSSPNKEHGPIAHHAEFVMPSEPTETAPEISAELQEAGVEESQDNEKLQLSVEDKLAGVEPAKESVPVANVVGTGMQIPHQPFTLEEAAQILKNTKTDDTKHWLAILLIAILHKKHFQALHQKLENKDEMLQNAA